MTKNEALALIDAHKNKLIDPVDMLKWTWLRVIILSTTDDAWEVAIDRAMKTLSQ